MSDDPDDLESMGLCPACKGTRYTARGQDVRVCGTCHGDGLARRRTGIVQPRRDRSSR